MHDPNLNRQLGPYRLQRVVGRGGMGTVYEARDEATEQLAAIKVLSPALAADTSFRERFASEIESLKQLKHANIVELYGFGQDDERLFYVMELVDGNSLQEELRCGRRFEWREVTRIGVDICAALKHAHDHGIIHRDLKPANLLLTRDDQIKLFDFGIAKLFGATGVTTDSVLGTADYMSPEQGEGKPVGPRSDLYSLGSVMYALLAGRPPFSGKSIAEVVHKVRFETPIPVGRLAADVPVELEHLIDQLLEKDPARRVPTALAVSHRLKAMEHALSIHPRDEDEVPEVSDQDEEIANRPTVQLRDGRPQQNVDELHVSTEEQPDSSASSESHFYRIDQTENRNPSTIPWSGIFGFAAMLIICFVAVVLFQRWRQPPSADALYEEITELTQSGTVRAAETQVNRFLELYSGDARYAEVAELLETIEIEKLQRRLDTRARRGLSSTSPLEQLYLAAIRHLAQDPELAARQLRALLDVYDNDPTASQADKRCLALARRRLAQLEQQIRDRSSEHLVLIRQRLDEAARWISEQQPDQAQVIYRGIIDLYADKPWAIDEVRQARQALESIE